MFSSSEINRCNDCCKAKKLIAVFFQKLAAIFKCKSPLALRQQREEKHGPVAQALHRPGQRARKLLLALQRTLYVPAKLFHARIADSDSEIAPGDIFEFMRFIENHRTDLRQDSRIRRVLRLLLDRQVGKEKMMIDDNDVAFHRPAVHLGDETSLPRAALLPDTRLGSGVDLVPQAARFRQ